MRPLRILGIADLHDHAEMLGAIETDVDLIAVCGDLHNGGGPEWVRPVAEALAKLGPPVLIVPGNMDHKDVVPEVWRAVEFKMIHNASFKFGDCCIIGFGGMVPHNPKRLGDVSRYYHPNEEIYESLARLNGDILDSKWRIVMTHQPPKGARDIAYNGEVTGSPGLRQFIEDFQPDLLMCGHIHEARGEARIGRTRIINVGELRRGYAAIVDVDEMIEVKWIGP